MYFFTHGIHLVTDITGGILDIEMYIVMLNTSFYDQLAFDWRYAPIFATRIEPSKWKD